MTHMTMTSQNVTVLWRMVLFRSPSISISKILKVDRSNILRGEWVSTVEILYSCLQICFCTYVLCRCWNGPGFCVHDSFPDW